MQRKEIVEFWVSSARHDFVAMEHLFESGDYSWALFVGHLVVEKLLKAWYAETVSIEVPVTHNLLYLAEKGNLEPTDEQRMQLVLLNTFNISARYPDYKQEFYRKCTREYAEKGITAVKGIVVWLQERI
jgi:HEPN domain-containing protein